MAEENRKAMIRLELTERQKAQIREATGRQVNSLELRLQGLPEPVDPSAEGGRARATPGEER
jgi:hypothetical protein